MRMIGHETGWGVWVICGVIVLALGGHRVANGQGLEEFVPPGPNLAQGKSYTLAPKPLGDYYCSDPGDSEQLTDGEYVTNAGDFHVQKGCVGWYGPRLAVITIDLGEVAPIAGLSFSTAAGGAGIGWPDAILILVSDDGQNFHYMGQLCALAAKFGVPAPSGYQEHRFCTDQLSTHGRFLRLDVITGGAWLFCDEIEVYGGTQQMLEGPVGGLVVADLGAFLTEHRTGIGIQSRIASDIAHTREAVAAAHLTAAVRQRLNEEIAAVQKANAAIPKEPPADYRAIYPLNDNHARLFGLMAQLRRAQGLPPVFLWHSDCYERLGLWDLPRRAPRRGPRLSVRMMSNERQAETLNIANFTDNSLTATVSFLGLPGGKTPEYITVQSAEYVAMQGGPWDANALPAAQRDRDGWRVSLPVGVSRQLWLSFHPQDFPVPGRYWGRIVVEIEGVAQKLISPLRLIVEPIRFPEQTTLALGMWDYADGTHAYDLKEGNMAAARAHMQSYPYNAPWAGRAVFPWPGPDDFDASGNLVKPIDFSTFDAWVTSWPAARYYMIFASVGKSFAGSAMGTAEFNQRVGATMHAWADHTQKIGIDPSQIAILLVDEPTTDEENRRILAWAQAIKGTAPELLIFEDPAYVAPPQSAEAQEMFQISDILCPRRECYGRGDTRLAEFYDNLRDGGRQLWFYTVSHPANYSAIGFRVDQWQCWIAQATGTHYWSYGDAGGIVNSWNQLGAKGTVHSPVYIDSTSVTDGKHWLAIIEGIQDYEYLRMLRDRVEQLAAGGQSSQALDDARQLLTTLPDGVFASRVTCDEGRLRVLDALLSLR